MKSATFLSAVFFLVTSLLPASDVLWQKAVDLAKQNEAWVPGKMVIHSTMTNKKGKVLEDVEMSQAVSLDAKGEIRVDIIKAVKDGKDVTEEERARLKEATSETSEEDSEEAHSIEFKNVGIFHPDLQSKLTVTPTGQTGGVSGKSCRGYEFTLQMEDGTLQKGSAWLEEETGVPVEVSFVPDPLPKHVKRMNTIIRYRLGPGEKWRVSDMTVEGTGGMLFIKRNFNVTTEFSDYWEYEEEKEETEKSLK